uniref:Small ribosomal subunit protein mS23 n=1 Tax=Guillardia theta TaxID=55529 RepID=A0A7S4UQ34_GUITH|mmetsp:Transcript_42537/g.133959  ORF Transcript_42537/g.133959 Transcript_42537/m.133959 type:complete len:184 (+) Transcript_42537:1-552(+)
MGKYRSGGRSAFQGGRALLAKVENLLKGKVMPEPSWYEPMRICMPPPIPTRFPKVKKLVFDDEDLFKIYKRRNPGYKDEPMMMDEMARKTGKLTRHFRFIKKWRALMEQGMEQEEAYKAVDQEIRAEEQEEYKRVEAKILEQLKSGQGIPIINYRFEQDLHYVKEALDYHKKNWEAKNAKEET